MKNQLSLEIKKPCSEKFSDFIPTKAGGFCGSCQEEVIDFTGMSSQEIINYFKLNAGKSTCGRFADHQLGTYVEAQQKSKSYSFWKGLGLACLSLFTFNTVTAQDTKAKTEIVSKKSIDKQKSLQENIIVKGVVSDENGPLPGANIILEGTTIGVETDFDGKFKFPKPLKKGDVLIFSFVGMETKKIVVENNKSANNVAMDIDLSMTLDTCFVLGKVAVKKVYKSKKKF